MLSSSSALEATGARIIGSAKRASPTTPAKITKTSCQE